MLFVILFVNCGKGESTYILGISKGRFALGKVHKFDLCQFFLYQLYCNVYFVCVCGKSQYYDCGFVVVACVKKPKMLLYAFFCYLGSPFMCQRIIMVMLASEFCYVLELRS